MAMSKPRLPQIGLRILRLLTGSAIIGLFALIAFYFWASRPLHSPGDKHRIEEYGSTKQSPRDSFSIMSFNIGWLSGMTNNLPKARPDSLFESNLDRCIRVIQSASPDLIAFQEIDFDSHRSARMNQLERIARACGYPYAALAINWDDRYVPFPYWPPAYHFGRVYSGLAVLSRFPILANQRILHKATLPRPFYWKAFYLERLFQHISIDLGQDTLDLLNVHLEAFDAGTRAKQAEELIQYAGSVDPIPELMAGDFNATWEQNGAQGADQTMLPFRNTRYRPSCRIAPTDSMYFTFSSARPQRKIDYILYDTARLDVLDCRVMHEMGSVSDHLPLMSIFKIKE